MQSHPKTSFWLWPLGALAALVAAYYFHGAIWFIRAVGIVLLLHAVHAVWTGRVRVGSRGREPSSYIGPSGTLIYAVLIAAAGVAVLLTAPLVTCLFLPNDPTCP